MDDLKKLISLYSDGNFSKKLKLFEKGAAKSLYNNFVKLVIEEKIDTETELIKRLYRGKKYSHANFIKLKERLFDKLKNIVLLIDSKEAGFSDRYQSYINIIKDLLIGRILLNVKEDQLGNLILDKALKKSINSEFLDLQHLISKIQATYYRNVIQNEKKSVYYSQIANSSMAGLSIEANIRDLSNEYFTIRFKSLANDDTKIQYDKYIHEAKVALEKSENSEISELAYGLLLSCFVFKKDKKKFLQIADQSISFFSISKRISTPAFRKICSDIVIGAFPLRQFQLAYEIEDKYLKYFSNKQHNWYALNYYLILIKIHDHLIPEAYELFVTCIRCAYFKRQADSMQQHFLILEAYFHFMLSSKNKKEDKVTSTFRLNKFLNEIPLFSKEKKGMNISTLVIQIAILLSEKKYDPIIEKLDAITQYSYRYLRKNEMWRSSCFVKMLTELAKHDFNKKWASTRISPLFDKLVSVPIDQYPGSVDIEIIPYEDLWEMILERLD